MFYPEEDSREEPISQEESKAKSAESKPKKSAKAKKSASEKGQAERPPKAADKREKTEGKEGGKSTQKAVVEAQKTPAKEPKPESKPEKGEKGKEKKKGKEAARKALPPDYVPRLLKYYRETTVPELTKRFSFKNIMMVPKLEKVVLNVGIGEASQNPKILDSASKELAVITGQKPAISRARKSISNFKLRKGVPIGCRVTLRRWQMYEFLDRLLNIAIPRIRDFRGLSDRSFDGRGNYTIGIKEHIIFPEIDIDKIERVHGLDITLVTTARTDEEAYALLQSLGVPFRKHGGEGRDLAA